MNLQRFYNLVCNEYRGIEFEIDQDSTNENKIAFSCSVTSEQNFDDGVYVRIIAYQSGTLHVFFTFDKLDKNLNNYELLNEFNCNSSFLKGYIDDINGKNFLKFHFLSTDITSEDTLCEDVVFAFDQLLADKTLQYLKPLTRYTY